MPGYPFETLIAGLKLRDAAFRQGWHGGGRQLKGPNLRDVSTKNLRLHVEHMTPTLEPPHIHSAFITPDPIGQAGFPTYHFFSENVAFNFHAAKIRHKKKQFLFEGTT